MASYVAYLCFVFCLVALSFSIQTEARESLFFSKYFHHLRRKTQENPESISLAPAQSPSLAPAPAPESVVVEHGYGLFGHQPVKSTNVVGEVKNVEAKGFDKKTFRDFVMAYPNDNGNGWNGNKNEKHGMSDTRFLENGKHYYDVNNDRNGNEKQGMSEYVEDENSFPENKGNRNGYDTEKHGMGEKMYLVNGKYYDGYVTGSKNGHANEKQGMGEYVKDENSFPENKENGNGYETEKQEMGRYLVNGKYYSGYVTKSGNEKPGLNEFVEEENSFPGNKENGNGYETEKQGMGEKKYLVNGKYYTGYVTGSNNGNGNEKQGTSKYVEDEKIFPENKENGNEYVTEKQGMGEKKYLVNGKYYSGYVTGSKNGNGNEKEGMSEYAEDENIFPENKENGNGHETEKQEIGKKKYLVNGKYYSGYVTGSKNGNGNEKQGMSENVEDENNFPENKENGNGHETEKQEMGRYLVNGKYYSGYVTKSGNGNGNGNERQGLNEFGEEENSFPENKENGNGYETEKQGMGEKYLVNGKYYTGYVTRSKNGNGNENQGISEYAENENFRNNKGNGNRYENAKQGMGEKYLVNGKYYDGYVTGKENENRNNQNKYEDLGVFNNKNEYENGYNENEFYDQNNESLREGRENPNGYLP